MIDPIIGSRAVIAYLSLLTFHVAHILEEVLGGFIVLHKLGLARFAVANWILFLIPMTFFFFWLLGRSWARRMSVLYAGFMILNGLGHNVMTLATGRYVDGYAGGVSGVGMIISGMFLLFYLLRKPSGPPVRT
jgi:hypothetical protein